MPRNLITFSQCVFWGFISILVVIKEVDTSIDMIFNVKPNLSTLASSILASVLVILFCFYGLYLSARLLFDFSVKKEVHLSFSVLLTILGIGMLLIMSQIMILDSLLIVIVFSGILLHWCVYFLFAKEN